MLVDAMFLNTTVISASSAAAENFTPLRANADMSVEEGRAVLVQCIANSTFGSAGALNTAWRGAEVDAEMERTVDDKLSRPYAKSKGIDLDDPSVLRPDGDEEEGETIEKEEEMIADAIKIRTAGRLVDNAVNALNHGAALTGRDVEAINVACGNLERNFPKQTGWNL